MTRVVVLCFAREQIPRHDKNDRADDLDDPNAEPRDHHAGGGTFQLFSPAYQKNPISTTTTCVATVGERAPSDPFAESKI
jgi:hypothetical protein